MREQGARRVLRADAVFDALAGLLLLSGTWDGFYRLLDLPQPKPALLAQLGGAVVLAFAYLLWVAAADRAVRPAVARAGAFANALGAVVILAWLLLRDPVGSRGMVVLVVIAVAGVLRHRPGAHGSGAARLRRGKPVPAARPAPATTRRKVPNLGVRGIVAPIRPGHGRC